MKLMPNTLPTSSRPSRWTSPAAVVCYFAGAKLLIHFLSNGQYGYFRDELCFIARGKHPHQNYYLWGPRGYMRESMIALGCDRKTVEEYCSRVEEAGRVDHPYAMAEERYQIFLRRGG